MRGTRSQILRGLQNTKKAIPFLTIDETERQQIKIESLAEENTKLEMINQENTSLKDEMKRVRNELEGMKKRSQYKSVPTTEDIQKMIEKALARKDTPIDRSVTD